MDQGGDQKQPDPSVRTVHICVCICTLLRPALLTRLLRALDAQVTGDRFTYSVVIADNDPERSSEILVADIAASARIEIHYASEPRKNIALARNTALAHAKGDYIAFIDDDEFPEANWLATMLSACEHFGVAGILGPVRPYFEEPPPNWIIVGGFCERREYPTGHIMRWEDCRTGNVLFRRDITHGVEPVFDPAFGSGGEDVDFFLRMMRYGFVFRWCTEGAVFEVVPRIRWTRRYMLKRALLRGRNVLKLPVNRSALLARSALAAPAYFAFLPIAFLLGQHVFMKYCIKLCDHAGRILAVMRINPMSER